MLHKTIYQADLGPVHVGKERCKKENNMHIMGFLWNPASELVVIRLTRLSFENFTFVNLYNYFLNAE